MLVIGIHLRCLWTVTELTMYKYLSAKGINWSLAVGGVAISEVDKSTVYSSLVVGKIT